MSTPRGYMWNSQRWKDARRRWDELPDKTWEEGTGFVNNPEKRGGRNGFPWIFSYLGKHGGMASQDWRREQWDRYKPHQIKTALQQLANHGKRQAIQRTYAETHGKPSPGRAAQQQHAATHGKPIRYPTGAESALKINKTGTTPSADEPMSMSGTDDTMQIGGKKRKPDTPSAGHNMSINI